MKIFPALSILVASCVLADGPHYAVKSARECIGLADYAIVSRALSKNGIDEHTSQAILHDTYLFILEDGKPSTELWEIADQIFKVARKTSEDPHDFSNRFNISCQSHRGNLDDFFAGKDT